MGDIRNTIRKEIKARTKELVTKGQRVNLAQQNARQEANTKYGHGWRLGVNNHDSNRPHEDPTNSYYGHENGEHWMD